MTTAKNARRLAITRQRLAGRLPGRPDAAAILSVVRDLGCLQLDPISVVAPSHLLVLWSRVGNFRPSDLDRLLWGDRKLFEYWAHQSSIVATEDYPMYYSMMKRYPESFPRPWGEPWKQRVTRWLKAKEGLRRSVLGELRRKGPLLMSQLEDDLGVRRRGSGWGSGSDVSIMLFHLLMSGEVMVVGHRGNQKVWDLSERFLPGWARRRELPEGELESAAVQRSLRALGVATASEIDLHFIRGRYRNLRATLRRLQEESLIRTAEVQGLDGREERYIHVEDIPLLDSMDSDEWRPRTTLLSPFDNLICDRARTRELHGFDYSAEIYVPRKKRKFGYYVLPVLLGDTFVGRIDPRMDRREERLLVNSVHAEPGAPKSRSASGQIADAVGRLAEFLGAREVVYSGRVPPFWRSSLR